MSNNQKSNKAKINKKNMDKLKSLTEEDIRELMKNRSYKRVNGAVRQTRY